MAISAKDIAEWTEQQAYTPAERAKLRYLESFDKLLEDSTDLMTTTVMHSGQPISDHTLRQITANQVYRRADESNITLTSEQFREQAGNFYKRLSAGVESKTRSMYESSKEAMKKGALTFPRDVVLSVEQN